MKRALLEGPGILKVVQDDAPEPGAGEVLVRVAACGICGSDLHAYNGEHPLVIYPVTPGHEFSGTVVATGSGVDAGLAGSLVCIEPSLYCGECAQCASGRYNICSNLRVMGFQAPGAFCDFIAVPQNRVHLLPAGVGPVEGALAEPAAVGVHAFARSGLTGGEAVLIVGAGVIGLMVMKVTAAAGCTCVMVEGDKGRAARALDMGADKAIVFGEAPADVIALAGGERGFGAVFECVGRAETIDLALRCAPRGGTVVAVGVPPGPVPVDMALVQDGELEVRGTLMYMGADFDRALELISIGAILADDFVTHRVSLDELDRGYGIAREGGAGTLKVLVDVEKG